jgi:hypothetical protein
VAAKRGAGEGPFWKRNRRWYGKRRIGPREAMVTIGASHAEAAELSARDRTICWSMSSSVRISQ